MKVLLFGMTGFGNSALDVLARQPFVEMAGVFTPKRQAGPFPYYKCRQLSDAAREKNIPLYEGLILRDKSTRGLISSLSPDLIVVSSFDQIVPEDIISIPGMGIINIHPSLLPRYRGPTPTAWVLINGEKETGVTAHFIEDERLDAGRIITQSRLKILPSDTDAILRQKLAKLSERTLLEALRLICEKDKSEFQLQDESKATYYSKRMFIKKSNEA